MKVQRILALTDLSDNSKAGLQLAENFARRLRAEIVAGYVHAPVDVLGALGDDPENARRLAEWARRDDEEQFRRFVGEHLDKSLTKSTVMVEAKSARDGVAVLIEKTKPQLVCMASHGRTGIKHALLGSVAEYTIRTAGVPVAVTKGKNLPAPEKAMKAMLALDLMEDPAKLIAEVGSVLGEKDELMLAHVVESYYFSPAAYGSDLAMPQPDVPRLMAAAEVQMKKIERPKGGPSLSIHIGVGRPTEGLLSMEEEKKPHLLIARTHARRGFDRLMLGSVSEYLARRCKAPVLILPK